MFPEQHDWLLIRRLRMGVLNEIWAIGLYNRLFFLAGGVFCLLWPLSDMLDRLRLNALFLRQSRPIWIAVLLASAGAGLLLGLFVTRRALRHADAPYLKTQPLSPRRLRRMAACAALVICFCTAPAIGIILIAAGEIVGKRHAGLLGSAAALLFALGGSLGLAVSLRLGKEDGALREAARRYPAISLSWLTRADRSNPAWLSSWASGLAGGRLQLDVQLLAGLALLLLSVAIPSVASLASRQAGPAQAAAVLCGLISFMAVARCRPLQSAALRTAPIGFCRAWFGMLRLPLLISAVFFAVPAGAAIAASPGAWQGSMGGGLALLLLDGGYAVFAAFFFASPQIAAASFIGMLCYAAIKWWTYHEVVYACMAMLLAFMVNRIRRRFHHGP